MGMDARLCTARSVKEFDNTNYWTSALEINEENFWKVGHEVMYWRKFYDLIDHINTLLPERYECADFIEVSKDMLKSIIEFCCYNRDYWDSFDTVPKLCEIYDHWDDFINAGLKLFFECDW